MFTSRISSIFYLNLIHQLWIDSQCHYSRASRYTTSSCTDLDNVRFWIGSKKIWDTRFWSILLEKHEFFIFFPKFFLRCTFFDKLTWDARIFDFGYLSLFLYLHNEHYNFQNIFFETSTSLLLQNYLGKKCMQKRRISW